MERALALYPELAAPDIRAHRDPVASDLEPLVIEDGCGLRPSRKDGIRLEVEWAEVPRSQGRKIPIIHNYGLV